MISHFSRTLIVALPLTLVLAACGSESAPEAEVAPPVETPIETPIADSLQKPIDKAKAVEDLAQQHKADMDKRLAEMEGVDADDNP